MKYLIFSDVHGNFSALSELFRSVAHIPLDRVVCLGDCVGYGAFPSECVRLIREKSHLCVMGNHDAAVTGLHRKWRFNRYAEKSLQWTISVLEDDELQYLASLPYIAEEDELCFVHGSPCYPEKFYYIYTLDNEMIFDSFDGKLCFCGHTHEPFVIDHVGNSYVVNYLELREKSRYIINVGSVGQPRDHDNRGCAVLYDNKKNFVQFLRFEYEIEVEAKAIQTAGLPAYLATRLYYGE